MIVDSSLWLQQFEHFSSRHKQFATHRAANLELPELDQSVNAEIIDPEHVGDFMNGIRQSLHRFHLQRRRFGFDKSFHDFKQVDGQSDFPKRVPVTAGRIVRAPHVARPHSTKPPQRIAQK
jgi:hypothetical protein